MHLMLSPENTTQKLPWDRAVRYCEKLTVDGHTGWRLPNRKELIFFAKHHPEKLVPDAHWTGTERWIDSPGADFVDINNYELYQSCWKETSLLVRAVRQCECTNHLGH